MTNNMFYTLQVTWISAHALYVPTHNSYHEDLCSVIREVLVNFLKCAHAGHKCLCINIHVNFIHNHKRNMNNLNFSQQEKEE